MRGYHRALLAGGVATFSLADVELNYRRGLLSALILPASVLSLVMVNQRAEQLIRALIERSVAAILDHRLWELLPEAE